MTNRSASFPIDRLAPNLALAAADDALDDAWRPVGAVAGDWLRRVAAARAAPASTSGEGPLVAWAAE